MDISKLTKDAYKLLSLLYNSYKSDIDSGKSMDDAREFEGAKKLHDAYFKSRHLSDVENWLWQLNAQGFIYVLGGDDSIQFIRLENESIAYFEHLPADTFEKFIKAGIDLFNLFKQP